MLEEKKITDKIEIVSNGEIIQVRERNAILKDGAEVASTFHRFVLTRDMDRTNLDPQIKKIADALWSE